MQQLTKEQAAVQACRVMMRYSTIKSKVVVLGESLMRWHTRVLDRHRTRAVPGRRWRVGWCAHNGQWGQVYPRQAQRGCRWELHYTAAHMYMSRASAMSCICCTSAAHGKLHLCRRPDSGASTINIHAQKDEAYAADDCGIMQACRLMIKNCTTGP